MADFVAVLRKTIGALGENTPEMREKVYEKARSTIEAKLAALNPQPPAAVIERQRKALEDAVAVLRADYAEPSEPEDDFDDLMASFEPEPQPVPMPMPPVARPVASAPELDEPAMATPVDGDAPKAAEPAQDNDVFSADVSDRPQPAPVPRQRARPVQRRSGFLGSRAGLAAVLVAFLVVAGGVYAAWMNRDALFGSPSSSTEGAATTAEELPAPEEGQAEEEVAVLPPEDEPEPAETPVAPTAPVEKFTQRLMADGSEIDDGPAGGQGTVGEGTSVATIGPAADGDAPVAVPPAGAETTTPVPGETAQPAVAVGQRAIFYEERTSSADGSAEMGSIVWTVVQESPGGDLPPEPAIRAEASIPAKDIQLRMTIRRNGDTTLPAAHIVEMIFLTPDGFEGGSIANVSRVALKETEQAAGNPLIGIPAKIADGFFLIALSDSPNEIQNNMTLLGSRSWIDIPIVYQSGRRALLSLEKGIPGERAFQETLRAWQEAGSAG